MVAILFFVSGIVAGYLPLNLDSKNSLPPVTIPPTSNPGEPRASLTENISLITDLSDNPLESLVPAIAVDSKKNVHVVWQDAQFCTGANNYIFYKMFNWTTQVWSSITNISESKVECEAPDIAVDAQDNVHVTWSARNYTGLQFDVYYRKFSASAGLWNDAVNVTNDAMTNHRFPKIAINNAGFINIVYMQDDPDWALWGRNSTDGLDWGPNGMMIYNPSGLWSVMQYGGEPSYDIAADKTYFHVSWSQDDGNGITELYYLNDTDGTLWDDGTDATLFHKGPSTQLPSIAVDNRTSGFAKVYIAWASDIDGTADILTTNMTGTTFFTNKPVNVSKEATGDCFTPDAIIDNTGILQIIYSRMASSVYELRLSNSSTSYSQYQLICNTGRDSGDGVLVHPTMAVDVNNTIHFAWEDDYALGTFSGAANTDILYRQEDRYAPQVKITSPANLTLVMESITILGTCARDTKCVNVSYQKRGSSTWININSTDAEKDGTHFQNGWSFLWQTPESFYNVTIRANATDYNGITDEFLIYNLTLDIDNPLISLVRIRDSWGHVYDGATNWNREFTSTITIQFTTSDPTTRVKNVSLWNGGTRLADAGWNDTNTAIIFDVNAALNGNYTQLHLQTYDIANHFTDTANFPEMRFDFYTPDPQFLDNRAGYNGNQTLQLGTKFRDTLTLRVNATAGYDTLDWKYVEFGNSSNGVTWKAPFYTNTSLDVRTTGYWLCSFDTSAIVEDWEYWFNATVYDGAGRNKTIVTQVHIDNNRTMVYLDIDEPSNYFDNDSNQEVGFFVKVNVLCTNDTQSVAIYNRSSIFESWALLAVNDSGTELPEYVGMKLFNYSWNTYPYHYEHKYSLYLRVICVDDLGWSNETSIPLILQAKVPVAVENLTVTRVGNSITVEWDPGLDGSGVELLGFRIYRLLFPPDVAVLNILNPSDIPQFLGYLDSHSRTGGPIATEFILDKDARSYTDTNLDPNTYVYIVLAVNIFGNPSNIPGTVAMEIPAQEPTREPDKTFDNILWAMVYVLVALWIIIPITGIVQGRRRGKADLIDFTMDANVIKGFQGAKSFESDVNDLDAKMRKELGMAGATPAETEFLAQEVVKKGPAGVEVKETTLRNCPKCGWVLSANATKCIRCGYILGSPIEGGKP